VKREFRRLDRDENGYIPADALQGVLNTLGVDLAPEELMRYVMSLDASVVGKA
jgi:Ca2+-binding EF-hand superfamily protein